MAITFEDECVGCPKGMGCLGSSCPYKNVPHWTCDECDAEVDEGELWDVNGKQICEECLKEMFPKVEYKAEEPDDEYDRADYEYDRWKDEE